ncbi:MAG: hypothetical protein FI731_09110 [SAR202 cluster bacterium]|nr:hypothetical protein [SAR202 cluster bacterium]|tara:strand:- start:1701 stop:2150 length:450 start_codon:yes stop_codon:yes gene_type:complete
MKSYYACLDCAFVKYAPQPLQHMAVANKASTQGGEVSFYTLEDFGTLANQGVAKSKLAEKPRVDGIIFFTLRQFFYGGLHMDFLKSILEQGYEVHFAREDISINSKEELDTMFPMLYSSYQLMHRDEPRDQWKPVWDALDDIPDYNPVS